VLERERVPRYAGTVNQEIMSLTSEQVEHIAKLARLDLTDGEKDSLRDQLSSILDYVSQLREIDTEGVEPLSYVATLENVWADDEIKGCSAAERNVIIENFPDKEGDLLKVKAVFS